MMQQDPAIFFIDVRTEFEFNFIGYPVGAENLPYLDDNFIPRGDAFLRDIRELTLTDGTHSKEPPIMMLICRSGDRSYQAAKYLKENGFCCVINVKHGFEGDRNDEHHRSSVNGWRFENLPWAQF